MKGKKKRNKKYRGGVARRPSPTTRAVPSPIPFLECPLPLLVKENPTPPPLLTGLPCPLLRSSSVRGPRDAPHRACACGLPFSSSPAGRPWSGSRLGRFFPILSPPPCRPW
ncbi:hypothetical protein BS78_01G129400 [Paspalum vaginatum]|nr:hypothetical protein BS78_01G129400 [Paspalum vaginatum]